MSSPLDFDGYLQELDLKFKKLDEHQAASERQKSPAAILKNEQAVYDFEITVAGIKENVEQSSLRYEDTMEHGAALRSGPQRKFVQWVKSQLDVAERELSDSGRAAVQREISLGFRFDTEGNSPQPIREPFRTTAVVRQKHAPLIASTPTIPRNRRTNFVAQSQAFPADMSPVINAPLKVAKSHDVLNTDFYTDVSNALGASLPDLTDDAALNTGNIRPLPHAAPDLYALSNGYISTPESANLVSYGPSVNNLKNNARASRRSTFSVLPDVSPILQELEKAAAAENDINFQNAVSKRQNRRTFHIPPAAAADLNATFSNDTENDLNRIVRVALDNNADGELSENEHAAIQIDMLPKNIDSRRTMTLTDHSGEVGRVRMSNWSSQNSSTSDLNEQQPVAMMHVNSKFENMNNIVPQIVKRGGVRGPVAMPSRNTTTMPNSISTSSVNSVDSGSTTSLSSINNPAVTPFSSGLSSFGQSGSRMPRPALPSAAQPSAVLPPSPGFPSSRIMPPVSVDLNRTVISVRGGLRPPGAIRRF